VFLRDIIRNQYDIPGVTVQDVVSFAATHDLFGSETSLFVVIVCRSLLQQEVDACWDLARYFCSRAAVNRPVTVILFSTRDPQLVFNFKQFVHEHSALLAMMPRDESCADAFQALVCQTNTYLTNSFQVGMNVEQALEYTAKRLQDIQHSSSTVCSYLTRRLLIGVSLGTNISGCEDRHPSEYGVGPNSSGCVERQPSENGVGSAPSGCVERQGSEYGTEPAPSSGCVERQGSADYGTEPNPAGSMKRLPLSSEYGTEPLPASDLSAITGQLCRLPGVTGPFEEGLRSLVLYCDPAERDKVEPVVQNISRQNGDCKIIVIWQALRVIAA
jgi:hypothetical protein